MKVKDNYIYFNVTDVYVTGAKYRVKPDGTDLQYLSRADNWTPSHYAIGSLPHDYVMENNIKNAIRKHKLQMYNESKR